MKEIKERKIRKGIKTMLVHKKFVESKKLKILFLFVMLVTIMLQAQAGATDYYIDSVGGEDNADGLTPSTAWQSHTKVHTVLPQPGDSVRFKRGSQFSGPIIINESGTAANPILLTDYGEGNAPRFTNPDDLDLNGNCIRISGDYIIVENLYFHDTPPTDNADRLDSIFKMGAIYIMAGADHNIIRDNVFWKCTKAIQSTGEYTLITDNYMGGSSHKLWRRGNGGWGPMGLQLGIGNQEVSYNTIKNYLTEESPYGTDGGAIEFDDGRWHKNNLYIHHNYSEGNAGFFESSWGADYNPEVQEVHNLRVAFNVNNDGQSYCYMFAPTHNTYFDDNTIIRANNYPDPYPTFDEIVYAAFSGLTFRNNLLVGTAETNNNPYNGASVTVQNSWYWEIGTSNGDGDPLVVDFNGGDYHLTSSSPLIGQAQNLSQHYSTDFDGAILPTSGPWDIGAYMFAGAACNLPGNLNDDYRVDCLDFDLLGAGWQISYDMFDLKEMAANWLIYCNISPYVVITSPSNGYSFDEGETITITADACDVDGSIIKVEFFDFDGVSKLGEDLTEPYSFDWMGASVGQHSLRAKATDNDDKTTTSAAVNITVIVPIPDPVAGKWRSFDVVMNPSGSPQATVTDGNAVTADLEFYESTNNDGVNKGSLFGTYTDGSHTDFYNHAEHLWGDTSGGPYPYAAKSTVARGSDIGEANTPAPSGVFDLQLHPPENNHLIVAAFIVPIAGDYSVYDLAVRRVWYEGDVAGYKVFDEDKNLLTHIVASTDQDWVTDSNTYNLGSLQAGDRIYFAVDREDAHYYWDATEIIWTIEKN